MSLSESSILVQMKGIHKRFPGVKALDNVEFELKAGEVHVLIGENGAGKSTLIKILSGVHQKDSGTIRVSGQEVEIKSAYQARCLGIGTIYQEFNLVPHLTVSENILLGREPTHGPLGIVDFSCMRSRALESLRALNINVNPDNHVKSLGVAQKQMVEIAKALSMNANILIMDEPTAVLTRKEIDDLFRVIRTLKQDGVGIIYISHRLEEIAQIGDRITVLRDGCKVGTVAVREATIDSLVRMMVGRELKEKFPPRKANIGEEVLTVKRLSRKGVLSDITFSVRRGEVVGLAGLVGAGRTELARAIMGADPVDSGEIIVRGTPVKIGQPRDAIARGIGYLPEERKIHGLHLALSVKDNITLASLNRLSKGQFIRLGSEKEEAQKYVNKLMIKTPSLGRKTIYLSGGNQQKTVLAKWLCTQCGIFLFDEPTRGIDVGAKVEIYNLINELATNGAAILMISSELPEILGMADRVLVMHRGRLVADIPREQATQAIILNYAMGISA